MAFKPSSTYILNTIKRCYSSYSNFVSIILELSEQKAGTSFIITSNDWSRSKNSTLQKLNTNYMQVPLIQKSGTVLSTNNSVDIQPQKSQQQTVRSVILPSNYRTATVSPQQGTDCKLVLNSINVSTQVSYDSNIFHVYYFIIIFL